MKKHALLVKIVIWDLHAKVRSPHSCRNVHFAFKSAKKKKKKCLKYKSTYSLDNIVLRIMITILISIICH